MACPSRDRMVFAITSCRATVNDVAKGVLQQLCGAQRLIPVDLGRKRRCTRNLSMLGWIDKRLLVADHLRHVAENDRILEQIGNSSVRTTVIDRTASAASTRPLATLKHISMNQLNINQQHMCCRLEGTVCCKATRLTAIMLLLQDSETQLTPSKFTCTTGCS